MHTATDYAALLEHRQRVSQAEQELARRLRVDESTLLPPRRRFRTYVRAVARAVSRRRARAGSFAARSRDPQRQLASR